MAEQTNFIPLRVPAATYRWQFNREFTFAQAAALVDYLDELGVSDCYASPIFAARPGSLHGYDVIEHGKLNPDLGTEAEFDDFAARLKQRGMGLILDVAPNHMCIAGAANRWWNDVLENGPSSLYAPYFDIDWLPPKADLAYKVLLPVLGEQYGRVLENQELALAYRRGAFFVHYYETRLPLTPRSYALLLEPLLETLRARLGAQHEEVWELESILTALRHLPPRTETAADRIRERRREKEIIKRRLAALVQKSTEAARALRELLYEFNGVKGEPHSFDRLEALLAEQPYRLSFWRVAADEINYRRFFDINELAAVRVEDPAVFAAVHELVLRLVKQRQVTGLRIDHVDGLFDPASYLCALQQACARALTQKRAAAARASRTWPGNAAQAWDKLPACPTFAEDPGQACYVVVEKILGWHERLDEHWPVQGTTGYEFLNLLNGLFVDPRGAPELLRFYERFTGQTRDFATLVYECKKLILRVALSSEWRVLAQHLERLSEQHRYTRDFTYNSLHYALGEFIACFPTYRSYTGLDEASASEADRRQIRAALRAAERRNPALSPSLFAFIGALLLHEDPEGLSAGQRAERRLFAMRLQQLTGPVMAKGFEDTACYRYFPLASLNEVGGEPNRFGVSLAEFHRRQQERLSTWPHSLSATSTHDTKRSEDVRARLNVLSEAPVEWARAVRRWRRFNQPHKTKLENGATLEAPDANDEYLLYQTLFGTWPLEPLDEAAQAAYGARIEQYMVKAVREAKLHSSWINPHEEYEQAVVQFVRRLHAAGAENRFLADFTAFQRPLVRAGLLNALAQTLVKITAPGAPDFYQGTELWDFSLVDPDNRRPVDYELRRRLLAELNLAAQGDRAALVTELLQNLTDGRLKLYLISRALAFRRAHRELFDAGQYLPLPVAGAHARQTIAFGRTTGAQTCLVATARFFTHLPAAWETTAINCSELQPGVYREVLTGRLVELRGNLPLAELFAPLPLALLASGELHERRPPGLRS
jgi:(1->4)-alpha-D-glucan 1-alpha-D-glucosylmutase